MTHHETANYTFLNQTRSHASEKESFVGPLPFFIRQNTCIPSFSTNTSEGFNNQHIYYGIIAPAKSIRPLTERFTRAINNRVISQTPNSILKHTTIHPHYETILIVSQLQQHLRDISPLQHHFPRAIDVPFLHPGKLLKSLYCPEPGQPN